MSKNIMGNGGFYGCLSERQGVSAWWKETTLTRCLITLTTTHNANRHCRVRFYTFMGQPSSKQLYIGSIVMQSA